MSKHIDRRQATPASDVPKPRMAQMMADGFHALLLLRQGCAPESDASLRANCTKFLSDFESTALDAGFKKEEISSASYAWCAALDETILRSGFGLHDSWQVRPLQLQLFGEQLAGEHFFQRLEDLRSQGSTALQVLEVYHLCLLHGFQGRYALEDSNKLSRLVARVADELAHMRGKPRAFAPHVERPDQVAISLGRDLSLLLMTALFACAALAAWFGMRQLLERQRETALAPYQQLVRLPAPPPRLVITLP